jgi:transposase
MAGGLFDPEARERILQNKNVLRISETTVTYAPAFKVEALRAHLAGKPPNVIFIDAGLRVEG